MSKTKILIQFNSDKTVNLVQENYSAMEVYEILCIIFQSGAVDWNKLEDFLKPKGTLH